MRADVVERLLTETDLNPDVWTLATEEEREALYRFYGERWALVSPVRYGLYTTPVFKAHQWLWFLDELVVAQMEDRLTEKGPAPFLSEHPDDDYLLSLPTLRYLHCSAPPRAGKTFFFTQVISRWAAKRWPGLKVVCATYSMQFAGHQGRDLRQKLEEDPLLEIQKGSRAQHEIRFTNGSVIRFTGVGGVLTGTGFDLGITDDLVKDHQDALSEAKRENADNFFTATWWTRREPGAKVLSIGTRWHPDDVLGRQVFDGSRGARKGWFAINLPALAEENDPLGREVGEALVPERYSKEDYEADREKDPMWFTALYQGRPELDSGAIFPSLEESHFYSIINTAKGTVYVLDSGEHLARKDMMIFGTMDLAITKNNWSDYTVVTIFGYHRIANVLLILDVYRDRVSSVEHEQFLKDSLRLYPDYRFVGIENKTFGTAFIQQLQQKKSVRYRPLEADRDKVTRNAPAGRAMWTGNLLLPSNAPWLEDYRKEAESFPTQGVHDDIIDTIGYGFDVVGGRPEFKPRFKATEKNPDLVKTVVDKVVREHEIERRKENNAAYRRHQRVKKMLSYV